MKRLSIDNPKKKVLINFRSDKFLFDNLKRKAEVNHQDLSSTIRELCERGLGIK